jgi:hypothetical protein
MDNYTLNLKNLEELNKFLTAHNLLKFNQEKIVQVNRLIIHNEIEVVSKNLPFE